jgi:hypothetical protein
MKQTPNAQPASAVLDGLRRGERLTLNTQFSCTSELEVGRWTLGVGRFLAALL